MGNYLEKMGNNWIKWEIIGKNWIKWEIIGKKWENIPFFSHFIKFNLNLFYIFTFRLNLTQLQIYKKFDH